MEQRAFSFPIRGLKISEETEGRTLSMTMTPTKTEAHSTGMPVIAIFFAPPTILMILNR